MLEALKRFRNTWVLVVSIAFCVAYGGLIEEAGTTAPSITAFVASTNTTQVGRSVVLLWEVTGDIESVQLFPINDERIDVTDRTYFTTPNFIEAGDFSYTLTVTGVDGSIVTSALNVSVSPVANQPIQIENVVQRPGVSIQNGGDGGFSFTVNDPERRDSSWKVRFIAGDPATAFPVSGLTPGGLGDVNVSVNDNALNDNGFFTFEISAFDDTVFGYEQGSTRAVSLVTFETTQQSSGAAPVISSAAFIPSGPDTAPGSAGVINFTFTDADTLNVSWRVSIAAGDFGGDLSPRSGSVTTGGGDISVQYKDDLDTPADSVVFLIRVLEETVVDPQSDIFLLRVDKSTGAAVGTGATE